MSVFRDLIRYVRSIFIFITYTIVRKMVLIVQRYTHPPKSRYDVSCQVMKIVWKRKLVLIDVVSPSDFIAVHQTYTSPNCVLRHNVSLYCVTKTDAVFVEVPEKIDIYSSTTGAFLYIYQFKHAVNVVVMPLASLHKLSKEISQPRDVCYVANTGRCGSTLLGQALERVPGTLLLSEPDALTNIGHHTRQGFLTTHQYEDLLVDAVTILCKPTPWIQRYCIKTRSCASKHIHVLSKFFPHMKFVFGYRNSLKTVSSFLGLMTNETAQNVALRLIDSDRFSNFVPFFRRIMHYYFCFDLEVVPVKFRCEDLNSVEMFTYAWCMCINLVKEFINQGNEILPVLYEDLLAEKRIVLVNVLKYLNIEGKYIDEVLKAFEQDSQKGSVLAQTNVDNQKRRTVSLKDVQRANVIMKRFGLPMLGEPFRFENMGLKK